MCDNNVWDDCAKLEPPGDQNPTLPPSKLVLSTFCTFSKQSFESNVVREGRKADTNDVVFKVV